jgi:excinuclease ABC subunit C
VIRDAASALPAMPGVYRMLGANGRALYIGKARSLRARVGQYTQTRHLSVRLQRMVAAVQRVEVLHTRTEAEALLLEANLIKAERPPCNILLRDDKSFPHILLRADHAFPQLLKHRGAQNTLGRYYGPFPGVGDVNRVLAALHKAFLLRNCSDSVFAGRTRPCLQYHIGRCTAPCVGYVDPRGYAEQVGQAQAFLEGRSREVQAALAAQMEAASARQDYEAAARYRDRLRALNSVSARQDVDSATLGDVDAFALIQSDTRVCVNAVFVRGGQVLGARPFFPRHASGESRGSVLSAFLAQFYTSRPPPPEVVLSDAPDDTYLLCQALSARVGRKVSLAVPQRGARRNLLDFARLGADRALARERSARAGHAGGMAALAAFMGLDKPPQRVEIYDNSHTSGQEAMGAMVVAGPEGFCKKAYRKITLRESAPGDDYGAMGEVLSRRLRGGQDLPDLIIVDGGAGHLAVARRAVEAARLDIPLLAVAKGPERNAGLEALHKIGHKSVSLAHNDPLLHHIQRLRDEAHRFAIGAHRARRQKRMEGSALDAIPGVGPARRRTLLRHFGSVRAVADAPEEELARLPGISKTLAAQIRASIYQIYSTFN